jgi:hypothetical protein
MVVIYILFSAFSYGYGEFYKVICEAYIRWMASDLIELTFNCVIVISIMYLHHKCAEVPPAELKKPAAHLSVHSSL